MSQELTISPLLRTLDDLCPAGYAIALHIRFTTPMFLFQTYSREWIDIYTRKGLVMQDPTVRWGFENNGTETWANLAGSDEAGVLTEAAEHGLKFGFVHALELQDSRSVASFARGDRDFTAEEVAAITGILVQLHELTRDTDALSDAEIAALKTLSITLTHAGKPVT
ncbi:autoinducer binding domain-containing protein [Halocynthiibacter styelae]|uniref:Autoinducer binding domain-containing protein n=1 Tax=Halocynthiibacter styelae TaxID=2761955 RepID=A0A8J7LTQ3_9RHOB|nr:autoinducer binding domain-containing protein [Paenihalocynthiibacter styelae]MBI1492067.1 autoinducer binding domain-containing protein [Paenihalocynthiibacter styelae]